ncbi:MAG TPA: CydX/CbdX family cytochrome bd oxidase small subunit [Candidatus Aphodousia faecigallinarum]|uniref:CydX/CbdX family cytochrome bd oxidase small subunit n=1 Tax=Candidatus Aphodousia faecigallinarum TaxID=2840677 RepID=A0A9D1IHX3_9BURK|nr:CydX/CbdX family cytochrome bd oxidase small subunit [Candidatus Aphodousia faecigallinarum]
MFYIYWFVGLLLAIVFAVLMAAQYELKNNDADNNQ